MKPKLRQFQWFEMETRVRQMVQELISPFTKRLFETINGINSLKVITNQEAIKLEEINKIVTNDPQSIDVKQQDLRTHVCELQNTVSETQKLIDKRMSIQDERLQQSKNIVLNNMKLKQRVSEQIFEQNQSIRQLRNELQVIVSKLQITLDNTIQNQQQDAKTNRTVSQKLSERITLLQQHSKVSDQKFQKNTKQHLDIQSKILHLEETTVQSNKQIESLKNNLVYIKKLGNYVKQLQQKIEKQDFSLQHLSPLVTQAQISQTLYSILPLKQKRKLVVYEYQKFSNLNNHILDTDPKKTKQLFNGLLVLENVQKRNVKDIIDMKRKKLISMGIDIDNLNYDAKEKYYKQVSLQQDQLDEEGQIRVSSSYDNNDITNTINKMIELASADFSMKISHELADSKKFFEQIQDQLQINFQKSSTLIDVTNDVINKFKVQQQLVNKQLEQQIDSLNKYKNTAKNKQQNIDKSLTTILQFCTLINHLQIQDELDKQSISLFGLKQQFIEQPLQDQNQIKKPIVNLQRQCFSCNGYPASTMSAFKMACLTYSPSSVTLDNKQYKRQELLEISTRILQHLKYDLQSKSSKLLPVLQTTIKKKAQTQPTMIQQQGVLISSPPKISTNRIQQFNNTVSSQIRSRTRTKNLKTQQPRRQSNAALLVNVFSETKRKHSMYFQKRQSSYHL